MIQGQAGHQNDQAIGIEVADSMVPNGVALWPAIMLYVVLLTTCSAKQPASRDNPGVYSVVNCHLGLYSVLKCYSGLI